MFYYYLFICFSRRRQSNLPVHGRVSEGWTMDGKKGKRNTKGGAGIEQESKPIPHDFRLSVEMKTKFTLYYEVIGVRKDSRLPSPAPCRSDRFPYGTKKF